MGKAAPTHDHHFVDYASTEADMPALVQAALLSIDGAGCSLRLLKVEPSNRKKAGDGPSSGGFMSEQIVNNVAS